MKKILFQARQFVDSLIVLYTPKVILKHFEKGHFKDNLTKDEHLSGYLPWGITKFYLTALLGLCYISSEELNSGDLGKIYIEERNRLIKFHEI